MQTQDAWNRPMSRLVYSPILDLKRKISWTVFSNSAVQYERSAAGGVCPQAAVAGHVWWPHGKWALRLISFSAAFTAPAEESCPVQLSECGRLYSSPLPSLLLCSSLSSLFWPREIPRRSALYLQRLQQHSFGSRAAMGEQTLITPKAQSGSPRSHSQREKKKRKSVNEKHRCTSGVSGKTLSLTFILGELYKGPRLTDFPATSRHNLDGSLFSFLETKMVHCLLLIV